MYVYVLNESQINTVLTRLYTKLGGLLPKIWKNLMHAKYGN